MDGERGRRPPEWEATVSEAVEHLEASEGQVADARARRARGRAGLHLALALPVLAVVLGWNAWLATRPPELPPDEDIALALRENAAVLVQEVVAFRDDQGRLPTPDAMAHLTDDEVTYTPTDTGFEVHATDGVVEVRYDGSLPLERWVAAGGWSSARGVP